MRRSISIDALDMSKSRHLMPNRTRITGSKNSWSVFRRVEVRSNPVSTGVAMSKTAIISHPPLQPVSGGSMNRSVWRVMVGVAGLAVLGMTATLASARTHTPAPGTSFRDCSNGCPEMVVVPQGRFTMGAPAGEEARANLPNQLRGRSVPQHLITIRHKLAIAKFDVTRDEYAQFVAETNRPDADSCDTLNASGGCIATNGNWHFPGFPQTGTDHVVCMSWDDA